MMNEEGIRELLIIASDLVKTKKDKKRLNEAIDTLQNPNEWHNFRFQ
jgi:hypothetical protein